MQPRQMRAVIFRDGEVWAAQCIDHDIAVQGPTIAELHHRLALTVELERQHTLRERGTEFAGIGPAPAYYVEMYEKAAGDFRPARDEAHMDMRLAA